MLNNSQAKPQGLTETIVHLKTINPVNDLSRSKIQEFSLSTPLPLFPFTQKTAKDPNSMLVTLTPTALHPYQPLSIFSSFPHVRCISAVSHVTTSLQHFQTRPPAPSQRTPYGPFPQHPASNSLSSAGRNSSAPPATTPFPLASQLAHVPNATELPVVPAVPLHPSIMTTDAGALLLLLLLGSPVLLLLLILRDKVERQGKKPESEPWWWLKMDEVTRATVTRKAG